jgi:hypothetical protein
VCAIAPRIGAPIPSIAAAATAAVLAVAAATGVAVAADDAVLAVAAAMQAQAARESGAKCLVKMLALSGGWLLKKLFVDAFSLCSCCCSL